MEINVDIPRLKLVLKTAEANYYAITQELENKGISDSERKKLLSKWSSSMGFLSSILINGHTYWWGIEEIEEEILKQTAEVQDIVKNLCKS